MVEFSFIIVTYNSQDLIIDAINSIYNFEQKKINYEIIIVDNSSVENHKILRDVLKNNAFDYIKIIHNPANDGYGGGNNLGIANSSGKYICIMNPDVRLLEPVLDFTKSKFISNSNLALVGYQQIGGQNISFYRKPEYGFFLSGSLFKYKNRFGKFNPLKDFLSGAFFIVSREKFEKIGFFDSNIFMYNEESDISNGLIFNGYDIEFDSNKKYRHLVESRPFTSISFHREMVSLKYYIDKHHLNQKDIINFYLYDITFKRKISLFLKNREATARFDDMINAINEVFFT